MLGNIAALMCHVVRMQGGSAMCVPACRGNLCYRGVLLVHL